MVGDFSVALPWRPRIDLTGRTTFTYDPDRSYRIVRYQEEWDIPASQALLQLLKPGPALSGDPLPSSSGQ